MKYATLFLAAMILCSLSVKVQAQKPANPEGIPWMSFEKAIETNKAAKKNKKKIFIDVYTDWCGWCKHMDNTTFKDSTVAALMNKYFLAVKLNAERTDTVMYNGSAYVNPNPSTPRSTHQLAITLLKGQLAYPAFVLMDSGEKVIVSIKGYRTPAEFIPILKYYGEDIYLTKSWNEYQSGLPDKSE